MSNQTCFYRRMFNKMNIGDCKYYQNFNHQKLLKSLLISEISMVQKNF